MWQQQRHQKTNNLQAALLLTVIYTGEKTVHISQITLYVVVIFMFLVMSIILDGHFGI
jgi:hypothetical protein